MEKQKYSRWIGTIAYGQYEDAFEAMENYVQYLKKQENYQLHINIGERYVNQIKRKLNAVELILKNLSEDEKQMKVSIHTRSGVSKEVSPAAVFSSLYVLLYRYHRLLGNWSETLEYADKALSISRSQEALNSYVSAQLRKVDPEGIFGKGKKSDKRPKDTSQLVAMMIESIQEDPFSPDGIESGLLLTRDLGYNVKAEEL